MGFDYSGFRQRIWKILFFLSAWLGMNREAQYPGSEHQGLRHQVLAV